MATEATLRSLAAWCGVKTSWPTEASRPHQDGRQRHDHGAATGSGSHRGPSFRVRARGLLYKMDSSLPSSSLARVPRATGHRPSRPDVHRLPLIDRGEPPHVVVHVDLGSGAAKEASRSPPKVKQIEGRRPSGPPCTTSESKSYFTSSGPSAFQGEPLICTQAAPSRLAHVSCGCAGSGTNGLAGKPESPKQMIVSSRTCSFPHPRTPSRE